MLHVKCPECGTSYKLSEDLYKRKAAGFGVVVTCRHCKTEIHVQNSTATSASDDDVFAAPPEPEPTTTALPPVAPKPAVGAPRPGGPPRPGPPPRPGAPPRPGGPPRAEATTPSPTPTRAIPGKGAPAKESPRLVALSPGLLGVSAKPTRMGLGGVEFNKPAPPAAALPPPAPPPAPPPPPPPELPEEVAPDSQPPESEDPPTERPPPPAGPEDTDTDGERETPVASTDFLPESVADSAPSLDSLDYTQEETSLPELPRPKRLPQAPPVRKLSLGARPPAKDELPSATSAPKIDALVHGPAVPLQDKKGAPRKRQASGDLTDDLLSADLGFDASLPIAPPDASALTRAPVSVRPAADTTASASKPALATATKQPDAEKKSSRGILWLLALVALGGSAFAFRDRLPGNTKPAPAAETPAKVEPTPAAPTPAPPEPATAEPVAEPTPEASASAAPVPEAPPTPVATTTAAPVATARPSTPSTPSSPSTPTAPTSKPTATAAATATTPNIPEPVGEATGPFDVAAAKSALEAAAGQASSCRKDGDPSGVAVVTITYSPTGRVTSANISGPPFAGTPTGGCIASTLRKAKVPPFTGDKVTIRKTVTIQ